MPELSELRTRLDQDRGVLRTIHNAISTCESALKTLHLEALDIEETGLILTHVATQTQQQVGIHIEGLVTSGIEAVFPDDTDYQFKTDFIQRRGQTEVDLMLADAMGNRIRPSDQDGGGLVDVAAFLLRVALWSLRHDSRSVIILDEPFRNLHGREDQQRVSELIKQLSEKLGLQFIIITGAEETKEMLKQANQIIKITKKGGTSFVTYESGTRNKIDSFVCN